MQNISRTVSCLHFALQNVPPSALQNVPPSALQNVPPSACQNAFWHCITFTGFCAAKLRKLINFFKKIDNLSFY